MSKSVTLAVVAVAFAAPASAHHGIGRFDPTKEIELEGTLTGLDFVNPHSYVYFNVARPDGGVRAMRCEMRAATVLRRSGWSPEMFVVGAHIKVHGHPHRDDPSSCYVETVAIGGAPTLARYDQLSDAEQAKRAKRPLRTADGRPNIAGDWAQEQYLMAHPPKGRPMLVPKHLVAAVDAGEVAVADVPDNGWFPRPVDLTAAGKAAAEALRNEPPSKTPRLSCQITSILFDWVFDGAINRISETPGKITLEYNRGLTRTVYMDLADHPASIVPSREGHSIGRWDGDTLVVDTVGFLPGRLAGTVPNSDRLHVVERFTLDPKTHALRRDYVATDSVYFTSEYEGSDTVLPADAPFEVDRCKELAYEYKKASGPQP
jgi:hypothetical protein